MNCIFKAPINAPNPITRLYYALRVVPLPIPPILLPLNHLKAIFATDKASIPMHIGVMVDASVRKVNERAVRILTLATKNRCITVSMDNSLQNSSMT